MKKLFTKIGQRVRNKSKQILAMLLCVTMLTPMAARAIITDGIYQAPEVARTWDENQRKYEKLLECKKAFLTKMFPG